MNNSNFRSIVNNEELHQDFFERIPIGYGYEDLIIRPLRSSIASRSDVDISAELFPGVKLKIPIIAAPMSTVCETKMCIRMYQMGALGILHRFAPFDKVKEWNKCLDYLEERIIEIAKEVPSDMVAFAIGIKAEDHVLLERLSPHSGIVCVDVNIGHHDKTINMVKYIKEHHPHLRIIAGNVSTYEGAYQLCEAGADCIRATNGGGSACITWEVTGTGVPSATALYECCSAVDKFKHKTVIADGGLRSAGHMVKAIALGADVCMTGGLIAGSSWCPESAFFEEDDLFKAQYYGMASAKAQQMRGGMKEGTAAEGVHKVIPVKGKTRRIINRLAGGIRAGCSFCNASNLHELQMKAQFMTRR